MVERPVIVVESGDDPVEIDPISITHVILIAEAEKTDASGSDPTDMVVQLEQLLNPEYWAAAHGRGDLPSMSALSHLALVSEPVGPDAFMATLGKLDVADDSSILVRHPTVSLDGGSTSQEVACVIVFRDSEPRILFSEEQEPVVPASA